MAHSTDYTAHGIHTGGMRSRWDKAQILPTSITSSLSNKMMRKTAMLPARRKAAKKRR